MDTQSGTRSPAARHDGCEVIRRATAEEPYARTLGMLCTEVRPGFARVELEVTRRFDNLFGMTHGGAVFSLIDEAFQVAGNSQGQMAFALNLSVTYVGACKAGDHLVAEAEEVATTRKTATYRIRVARGTETVALAQALAYVKGGLPPFFQPPSV